MQESQYRMNILPNDVSRMETLIHDHDANKPTVMELFKFSNTEAQALINKINESVSAIFFSKLIIFCSMLLGIFSHSSQRTFKEKTQYSCF